MTSAFDSLRDVLRVEGRRLWMALLDQGDVVTALRWAEQEGVDFVLLPAFSSGFSPAFFTARPPVAHCRCAALYDSVPTGTVLLDQALKRWASENMIVSAGYRKAINLAATLFDDPAG